MQVTAVYWNKGPTYERADKIIEFYLDSNPGTRSGPGFDEGLYDITANFSLIIHNVEIQNEDRYYCVVLGIDTDTGSLRHLWNYTDVNVIGKYSSRKRVSSFLREEIAIAY